MRNCVATCAHRRFVYDYQSERMRQEMVADDVSIGYATERAMYLERKPLITFKKWLIDHASGLSALDDTVETTPDDWEPPPGF